MKGYFLTILICIYLLNAFSQDIVPIKTGLDVNCKTTSIDSTNAYPNTSKGGNALKAYVPEADVKDIKYGYTSKSIPDTIKFEKLHLFSISTGYSSHLIKDDVMSPYIYSGSQAPLCVNYRYMGIKTRHASFFYFDRLKLNTSFSEISNEYSVDNINVLLDYSYNFRFYSIPKYRVQCFVGGKFNSLFNFRNYHYNVNNQMNMEFTNSIGVNFILEKMVLTRNDYLYLNINFPIIAYSIWNNIYNAHDKSVNFIINEANRKALNNKSNNSNNLWPLLKNGEFITVNKLIEIQTEILYTKFISKRIGIDFKYRFHFYSFAQYKHLFYSKYLNTQFLLGLTIKM